MLLPADREAPMTATCSEQVIIAHICKVLILPLKDGVLLGDTGFASSPFLMTPYTKTQNEAQEVYNNSHAKTSNNQTDIWSVEKAFTHIAW